MVGIGGRRQGTKTGRLGENLWDKTWISLLSEFGRGSWKEMDSFKINRDDD